MMVVVVDSEIRSSGVEGQLGVLFQLGEATLRESWVGRGDCWLGEYETIGVVMFQDEMSGG
jgi:hypothetical protein